MPTETVVKSKSTKTCRNCKSNLAGSATKCQNCGSADLAKSLIIIRKSEMTGEDALAPDPTDTSTTEVTDGESETDEEDEYEDLDETDFEGAEGDDEDDEDEDDEEDSEDEDAEEDDEDEEEDPKVTKRIVRRRRVSKSAGANAESVNMDIMLAALTVAEDITEAVAKNDVGEGGAYDTAMHTFNNVCDAAVQSWGSGESISKEDDSAKLKRLKARVAEIRAKLSGGDDEDDEEDDVEKSDDIFKGLNPAAAAILKQAQEIQERDKKREFEDVAKSFGELPTPTEELGAALRILSAADATAYETVTKALKAAAEQTKQSDIFKSFGSAQAGLITSGGTELETIAKSIQAGNTNLTSEQAYAEALRSNPSLYDEYIAKSASR